MNGEELAGDTAFQEGTVNLLQSILLFLVAVTLTSCISPHNIRPTDLLASEPRPFTVMTYNIRTGVGAGKLENSLFNLRYSGKHDLEPLIQAIQSVDPDVLGLQEVLGCRQAAQLAEALNMNYAYISHGMKKYGTWWGVAILSKFPIQKISRQVISRGHGNTRANLIADIEVFGEKIVFFCVHRDPHQSKDYALRLTAEKIGTIESVVVLMGDLNILPEDEVLAVLDERLEDTALVVAPPNNPLHGIKGTYPSQTRKKSGKRIDYVLVDKEQFEVLSVGLTGEEYWQASDHRGYYATLLMKAKEKPAPFPSVR